MGRMSSKKTTTTRTLAVAAMVLMVVAASAAGVAAAGSPSGATTSANTVAQADRIAGNSSQPPRSTAPRPAAQSGSRSDGGSRSSQSVRGSPEIDVIVAGPVVNRGGESRITLQLLNSGEVDIGFGDASRVTTARGVSVRAEAADDAPIEVVTDTVAVGTVTRDAPATAPMTVSVPADADAGEYELTVTVEYEYTAQYAPKSNAIIHESASETVDVTIVVEDGARFSVVDATTDAQVGGSGNLTLTVKNVGETAAEEARIGVGGKTLQVDGGTRVVGDWPANETRTVTYDVAVASGVRPGPQEVTATVEYTDTDGNSATSRPLVTGVTPAPEQSFTVADVNSTLAVSNDGRVRMTVRNDGPEAVEDAVVTVRNGETLGLAGEEYAVGDLAAGQSATVTFETTVGADVDPGPRLLTLDVTYADDGERRSAVHDVTAEVAPASDEFSVELRNGTVTAGETRLLEIAVTNERDHAVSDVSAKLFAENPLTALDDEAFGAEIEPGETVVFRFEYRVAGDALAKEYPVALDFQYEDHRGETRLSETYRVPVTVQAAEDGSSLPVSVLLVAVISVLSIVGIVYSRRT